MKWYFPRYDPDTKEALSDEMELEKVGEYNAVGQGGRPVPVPLFDETGLDWLAEYARDTIRYGLQFPFLVTGLPGRGKSTFASKLLTALRPNMEHDRVHYYIENVLERIEKDDISTPDNINTQLYDEAVTGLFNQEWQSAVTNIKVLNVVRMKLEVIGYVLPSLSDMNSKLYPMMQAWIFLYRKGVAEVLLPLVNKFDGSVYWRPVMAIQFGPMSGDWWDRYNERKYHFIQEYTSAVNQGEIGSKKHIAVMNQRDELIERIVAEKWMTVTEIAEMLHVRQNTVSQWRSRRENRMARAATV